MFNEPPETGASTNLAPLEVTNFWIYSNQIIVKKALLNLVYTLTYRFSDIWINGTRIDKDCFVTNTIFNDSLISVCHDVIVRQHCYNEISIFRYVFRTWAHICSFSFKSITSWSRHIIYIQFVALEKKNS